MKTLKQLREVLGRRDLRFTGAWPEDGLESQDLRILFASLGNNIPARERMEAFLYENQGTPSRFSNLKSRLKASLINRILLVRPGNLRQQATEYRFFQTHREFLAIRFLLFLGARSSAIRLLERLLPRIHRMKLTQMELTALQVLRHHYGVLQYDRSRYLKYHQASRDALELFYQESITDSLLEELLFQYRQAGSGKTHLTSLAQQALQQIDQMRSIVWSDHLEHRYRFIQVIQMMGRNNYEGTAQTCEAAIEHFKATSNCPPSYLRAYLFQLVVCRIQLGDYQKGYGALEQLETYLYSGNSNWFKAQELKCLLYLRTSRYYAAFHQWQQTVKHPGFQKLYTADREIWRIVEAFLNFLQRASTISEGQFALPRFRMGRFMNQVPTLSKDKQGHNVTILVLQLLFLIQQRKHDAVIDRIEAIEKYAARYLRGDRHRRSRYFLKMVVQIPKANYHPVRIQRLVDRWYKKLLATPPLIAREPHEIEFIPYERLWKTIQPVAFHQK